MYYQYFEDSDFPYGMDAETARMALSKSLKLQKKLKYAYLSKTTYIKGCQCLKALWLYKNRYNIRRVSEETQEKFNRGHIIGDLAQKLFPQGQDPFYPYSRKTKAHFEPEISAIFNKKSSFSLTFKENIGQKHRFIFLE